MPGYLETSMDTFLKNQEKLRAQVAQAFDAAPAMASLEAMTRANMEIYENAMRMFSPFSGRDERAQGTPGQEPRPEAARDEELEELKGQLRDMQAQLSRLVRDS